MSNDLPSGRGISPPGGFGRQLTVDTTREGVIDDGNVAWPERITEARRQWPQASLALRSVGDLE
jgi:hypothetical protein